MFSRVYSSDEILALPASIQIPRIRISFPTPSLISSRSKSLNQSIVVARMLKVSYYRPVKQIDRFVGNLNLYLKKKRK